MFFRKLDAALVYYLLEGGSAFLRSMIYVGLAVYYVTTAGLNPLQLVLVGTVLEITCFLFEIPTGVVADTFSRRLSVITGIFLTGTCFMIEGLVPVFWAILMAEVIRGVGETFISGALQAWIADEVGEENVGKVYLRSSQVNQLCGIIGTLLGVTLGSLALGLPVLIGGSLMVALSLLLLAIMPERGFQPTPREDRNSLQQMGHTFMEGLRSVRGRPVLVTILIISVFMGAYSESFDRLWEAHLLTNFTFPEWGNFQPVVWFGILSVGTGFICMGAIELFRRKLNLISQNPASTARVLLILNLVTVGSVIGFALAGNFAMAVGALLVKAIAGTLAGPLYDTWLVQNIDPKVRATVLSMSSQTNALGQFTGGPFIGLIGTLASLRVALVAGGVILSPVLLLYRRTLKQHQRHTTTPETAEVTVAES